MSAPRVIARVGVGTQFRYDGHLWRVVALDGSAVRVRNLAGELALIGHGELLEHADFDPDNDDDETQIAPGWSPLLSIVEPAPGLLDAAAPSHAKKKAEEKSEAVHLLLTGYPDGIVDPSTPPHPVYGPQNGQPLASRIAELARDREVGASTVERWLKVAREHGTEALIDKRTIGGRGPLGQCPPEVVEAMVAIAAAQSTQTKVTDTQLLRRVKEYVAARHGEDVRIPADSSLRRYWSELKRAYGLRLPTKTQQGNSLRPAKMGSPLVLSRPFELVEIDSTPLDVFAISEVDGKPITVVLTLAIDVFSRSLVAWQFSPKSDKAADAALLLHDMITPKAWLPDWSEHARWRYGVPETIVLPGATAPLSGVPVGVPTTLSLDNGKVYASHAMKSACVRLGISLQYSRVARPTDKPHIERVFSTIRTRFVENLPGYKGPSVDHRGTKEHVEDRACLFISEIEELFAQWVATDYQNRPHKGLVNPVVPSQVMTPNEAFDAGVAATGFVPLVADADLAISLLPATSRSIGTTGIEVGGLMYDSPALDGYRKRKSPFTELKGKWAIRSDARDLSHIWFWACHFQDATVGQWVRIPARITRHVGAFSDIHLQYAKSLFTDEDRQTGRAARTESIEATMVEMFARVRAQGPANPREATVFRLGQERAELSLEAFPHPLTDAIDTSEAAETPDVAGGDGWDFDVSDLEPFPMAE